MNRKELLNDLMICFNWAFLTLGASELMLLIDPVYFFVIVITCYCLFAIYAVYIHAGKKTLQKLSKLLLLCAGIFILIKSFFYYLVVLDHHYQLMALNVIATAISLIVGFALGFLLLKSSHGS